MAAIKFTDNQHFNRMVTLLHQAKKINETSKNVDIEYGSAAYLLASNEDIYNKARNYVSIDGIDFRKMMTKQDFSSGQKVIVKLAGNLFNGSYKAETSPISLIWHTDTDLFEVAMSAIKMRFGGRLNLGTIKNLD